MTKMSHSSAPRSDRASNASSVWTRAQQEELHCWDNLASQLNSESYRRAKAEFWVRVLAKAGVAHDLRQFARAESHAPIRVLDVGCGPSGIMIALPRFVREQLPLACERLAFTGVDPLMREYQRIVPWLNELPVRWAEGCAEDLTSAIDQPQHLVTAFNAIDHSADLEAFLSGMKDVLVPSGKALISVNCHTYRSLAWLWRTFGIEALHTHQLTRDQYERAISRHFVVRETLSLAEDVHWLQLVQESSAQKPLRSSRRGLARRALARVGLPHSPSRPGQRSIFHHWLFVCGFRESGR